MPLPITALYAALLAGLFLVLSVRVISARRRYGVALGTPHRLVERAVRAHANFAEYVPIALVLLGLLEGMGLPGWWLHALGTALVAGRAAHAWGISQEPEVLRWRSLGMGLTFAVLGVSAAALLALALAGL
ncbi:MAG: MAPEG family protein [Acetobacteraceae bacterium]|nr:MAPEG family protein [Acetobacteraceae bacterium]